MTGSQTKVMTKAKKIIMVALFLLNCIPQAKALEPEEIRERDNTPRHEEEPPSMELIEFIGEWETEDGDWINPEELADMPLNDNGSENDKTNDK